MVVNKIMIKNTTTGQHDSADIGASAENISFDPTGSNLESTDTESAIKEVYGAIPANTSQLINDSNFVVSSSLANVATSGDYEDLSNTPTLADVATSGDYDDLSNKPVLATVATSGSYNDLSNTPTIPSIEANPSDTATNTLTKLEVNGTVYDVASGSGGSTVAWNQIQTSTGATKIAEISIDGNSTDVYAPNEDGSDVIVTNTIPSSDTTKRVVTITVDGIATDVNADDAEKVIENLYDDTTVEGNPLTFKSITGGKATACKVTMNPIQDLHGYEYPWAGGAGKNKFQTTATSDTISGTVFTVNTDGSVTIKNTPSSAISSYNFGVITLPAGTYKANGFSGGASNNIRLNFRDNDSATIYAVIYDNRDIEFTLTEETNIRIYPIVPTTYDGNEVTMYPMIRLSTVTDDTFEPYENICPISGRTEASFVRTGKNLISGTLTDMSISSVGKIIASGSNYNMYIFKSVAGATYIPSSNGESVGSTVWWAEFEDVPQVGSEAYNSTRNTTPPFTATINGYIAFRLSQSYEKPQVDIGQTITTYEPPVTPEIHTHQYSDTIYGGVDDFVNGGATSEYELFEPTTVTTVAQSSGLWYWAFSLPKTSTNQLSTNGLMSSHFNPTNQVFAIGNCYITANGTLAACVPSDQTLNTGTLVNAWLAENDLQFAYKPITPATIQTSAENVTLLKGVNVLSTDGDDIELTAAKIQESSGGLELPEVTSTDAGKFLTVNSLGIWDVLNNSEITVYQGTPMANVQNDSICTLTKIETDTYILYQLRINIHMNGSSTGIDYLPLFTFSSGVIDDLDWITYLVYAVNSGQYDFSRVRFNATDNSIGGYYGTFNVSNGWYSNTPLIYIIPKN